MTAEAEQELRSKLDTASLMPRGRWKALWEAVAADFANPARELVDRLLSDGSKDGVDEANAWLLKPEGEPPRLAWGAWVAVLASWKTLSDEGGRKELRQRAKAIVNALGACSDAERVLPLVLAGIGPIDWRVSFPLSRAKWLEAHPLGLAAAVACLTHPEGNRDHAMRALAGVRELPVEARAAMWLVTWSDPTRIPYDYLDYARLREPAAMASMLHESYSLAWDQVPTRPAVVRALCRIIKREDPWLEPRWSEENYEKKPIGPPVLQQALHLLPRLAAMTGCEELARETLDTRWQALGFDGAVARGRLGGADAIPALVAELGGEGAERALVGLTGIGHEARSALDAIRAAPECRERTLALAAIDGSPATLDALLPICDDRIARAEEILMQYQEGLITADEYARWFDPAADAVRSWEAVESTPERAAMRERLRDCLAKHDVIHDDSVIKRLLAQEPRRA